MFYQSVAESTISLAVVSWGEGIKAKDANRRNKLIKKAESVVDLCLSPWRRLWWTGCWEHCWQLWTMSLTPSTKLWTSLRAASATCPILYCHQFHTAVRGPTTLYSICVAQNPSVVLNFSCLKVALLSSTESRLFLCLHL